MFALLEDFFVCKGTTFFLDIQKIFAFFFQNIYIYWKKAVTLQLFKRSEIEKRDLFWSLFLSKIHQKYKMSRKNNNIFA